MWTGIPPEENKQTIAWNCFTVKMIFENGVTHKSLVSFLWENANSADPDQMLQKAGSDQGIH